MKTKAEIKRWAKSYFKALKKGLECGDLNQKNYRDLKKDLIEDLKKDGISPSWIRKVSK
jgi:hypothetical protein